MEEFMKRTAIISLCLAFLLLFSVFSVFGETVSRLLGDINGDDKINSLDYLLLKRYCFGTAELNYAQKDIADVDRNGSVDSQDYISIKRHCLGNLLLTGNVLVDNIPDGAFVPELVAGSQDEAVMAANTANLQACVDRVSEGGGGTVYIPSGTYYFSSQGPNARNVEEYVCMPKDNVLVMGAGRSTVLMPVGVTERGLDMFYYNEYADSGFTNPQFLINADFRDLVVDGAYSNAERYTSAGKGFMINLFQDCDYYNVVVRNTDGTGFGMDCPVNCTIINCEAYNNGKLATTSNVGASGFGIGTGVTNDESLLIDNCYAEGNKKFGFFFEHQGRFQAANPHRYPATKAKGYIVQNCTSKNNLYDFGGELAHDVTYINCTVPADTTSANPIKFRHHSIRCYALDMNVEVRYEDVTTSSQYYDEVYWAVNRGITNGTSTTKFSPDNSCTVAAAITMLYRYLGYPGDLVLNNVSDTSDSQYPLIWAVKKSMVAESDDTTVACTYDNAIKYLWMHSGKPQVSGSYANHINWALANGIISSVKTGNITRAEFVSILYNYDSYLDIT